MTTIVLRGKQWPALFDLANVREMAEHYGDLDKMAAKMFDLDEMSYLVALMIREGVALDNALHHKNNDPPGRDAVRCLLTFADVTGKSELAKTVENEMLEFWGKDPKNGYSPEIRQQQQRILKKSKSILRAAMEYRADA